MWTNILLKFKYGFLYKKGKIIPNDYNIKKIVVSEIDRLGKEANLNHIDVSNVTNMFELFKDSEFNGDISLWDVSNVRNMRSMFQNSKFSGDISNWNVGNVIDMSFMFENSLFDGDISNWNVGNVRNMFGMFYMSYFNSDISNWNVSNVMDMSCMFQGSKFNGDISSWDVSNVKKISEIFSNSKFNGDISKWSLTSVDEIIRYEYGLITNQWWYPFIDLFGTPKLIFDSLDFGWIDLERKIIYTDKLLKTLKRGYNTKINDISSFPYVSKFKYVPDIPKKIPIEKVFKYNYFPYLNIINE